MTALTKASSGVIVPFMPLYSGGFENSSVNPFWVSSFAGQIMSEDSFDENFSKLFPPGFAPLREIPE
jgi:hypothetical protein